MKRKELVHFLGTLLVSVLIVRAMAQDAMPFTIRYAGTDIVLPFSYRNNANPVIPVMVNGKGPYRFMFDTGSPGLIKLDEALAKELALSVVDSVRADDGSGRGVQVFPVVQLDSVKLGHYAILYPQAMVRSYNRRPGEELIDGVMGVAFFPDVTLSLLFSTNQLRISQLSLEGQEHSQPIELNRGVPRIKIKIGNRELNAVFDTGNSGLLTLHSSQVTKEMMLNDPVIIGRARTVNNEFEIKQVQLKEDVTLGETIIKQPTIVINDLLPQANMGIGFLRQFDIVFDLKHQLVKLVRNEAAASSQSGSPATTTPNEYAGQYGDRSIRPDANGSLYIQRPGGMPLKLLPKSKDEFGLENIAGASLKFERDNTGKIIALLVSRDGNHWERAVRN